MNVVTDNSAVNSLLPSIDIKLYFIYIGRAIINKDCGNMIDSLINYNKQGKADEPLKDFFDVIRYLRMSNGGEGPDFMSSSSMQATKTNKGGY